jgi:hypothetical protein
MKKLHQLLIALVFMSVAFASDPKDPFEKQVPDWWLVGILEKPYQLEIAYGESERETSDSDFDMLTVANSEFLETATQLRIATSSSETGEFEEAKKHIVRYKITENDAGFFDLKIYIKTFLGGLREVNTDVTLKESEWVVLSGLLRPTDDGKSLVYTISIRVTLRDDKAGEQD